jgi:Domain of unknown function DUF29
MASVISAAALNLDLALLYEQDYHRWLEITAQLIRSGDTNALDWANLLDEIEDMGKSEKRSLYSNLKILLLHLLKYRYQSDKRSTSWKASIVEHRQRIHRSLQESPSLKPYLNEIPAEVYRDAKALAIVETGLDETIWPTELPFSLEDILQEDYFPDISDAPR